MSKVRYYTTIGILIAVLGTLFLNKTKPYITQNSALNQAYGLQRMANHDWHDLSRHKNLLDMPAHIKSLMTHLVQRRVLAVKERRVVKDYKKRGNSSTRNIPLAASFDDSQYILENPQYQKHQTYIYISEYLANDVIRCKIDNSHISACKVVLGAIPGIQHILTVKDRFYAVSYSPAAVFSCALVDGGDIESCSQNTLPINNTAYIMYDKQSLLITDMVLNRMSQCNLDNNFVILDCLEVSPIISATLLKSPERLFNTATYQQYTYLTVYDTKKGVTTLNKCVDNICSILYDAYLGAPNSVKILNNVAYITDGIANNLLACPITPNGDFGPCRVLKNGLKIPIATAFYQT